jgi:cytochrome c oxidase subunit 2
MRHIHSERLALSTLFLILLGLPAALLGYQYIVRTALSPVRVIDIRAAAPEGGGFQPSAIQARVGEPVLLRFAAEDVTHGIAIGPGLQIDVGHVDPGQVKEVLITFEQAGTYTFYCNTWCSPNHWRMRGVIEVYDAEGSLAILERDPVIEALLAEGVDIDANLDHTDHAAEGSYVAVPKNTPEHSFTFAQPPSAVRGRVLFSKVNIPTDLLSAAWRRSHTPAHALHQLLMANPSFSEAALADVVAYLWVLNSLETAQSRALYAKNCAACHAETGGGGGLAAALTASVPSAFANPSYMFTMRSDVLYAKTRRGGMGTDMPNFGTLFTTQETWAMVDYLWQLAFGALSDAP